MDVRVGALVPEWRVSAVSAEKMKTTAALLADPNPIHWDIGVVQALGMGDRPINQGPLNMAYVLNMLAAWSGGHDRVREFRVRFRGNVFAGDQLRACGVVTGVRARVGITLVDCDVCLEVVGERTVLSGTSTVVAGPVSEEKA